MNFKQIILFHPDIFFWKKISFFCPWEDKRTFVKNGTFSGGEGISGLSLQHKLLTDPHSGPVEEPRINDLQKHLPQGAHHCFMAVLLPELWVLKQGILVYTQRIFPLLLPQLCPSLWPSLAQHFHRSRWHQQSPMERAEMWWQIISVWSK